MLKKIKISLSVLIFLSVAASLAWSVQNWTDDTFSPSHIGQTDLQNMENNFLVLRSTHSGPIAPANPVAGLLWADTSNDRLRQRNEANTDWLNIFNWLTGRAFDSDACSGVSVIAGAGLSGGGALNTSRTISHPSHSGEVTGVTSLYISEQAVNITKMNKSALATLPMNTDNGKVAGKQIFYGPNFSGWATAGVGTILNPVGTFLGWEVYMPSGNKTLRAQFNVNGTGYVRINVSGNLSTEVYVAGQGWSGEIVINCNGFNGWVTIVPQIYGNIGLSDYRFWWANS